MFFEGTLSPSANTFVELGALQPSAGWVGERPNSGRTIGLVVVDVSLLIFDIPSVVKVAILSGDSSQNLRLFEEPKLGLGVVKALSFEQLYRVGQQPRAV